MSFARGACQSLVTIALFVGGGLGFAATLPAGSPGPSVAPALYPPPVPEAPAEPAPRIFLVDGYNAINVGLLAGRVREGWWSARHRGELIGRLAAFEEPDAEIWVVFDGAHPAGAVPAGRVRSVFAPDADAWLLARLRERGADGVTLVTADRRLANRARSRGAAVETPSAFLARCAGGEVG